MAGEYCKYILTKGRGNTGTSLMISGQLLSKVEFYQEVNYALDIRKKEIGIVDNFDADYFLFSTVGKYFTKERIFRGYKVSDSLLDAFTRNEEKLHAIKSKWIANGKKGYAGMYDSLFEIFSQFMIILENVRLSIEEEKLDQVDFRTSSVNIRELLRAVDETKQPEKMKKKKNTIPTPVDLIKGIAFRKKKDTGDLDIAYYYFFFIMHATYTRNEELKIGAGNGW